MYCVVFQIGDDPSQSAAVVVAGVVHNVDVLTVYDVVIDVADDVDVYAVVVGLDMIVVVVVVLVSTVVLVHIAVVIILDNHMIVVLVMILMMILAVE